MKTQQRSIATKNYLELLILAYCRKNKGYYSLADMKNHLGITFAQLSEILEKMTHEELLSYNEHLLNITQNGQIMLSNSELKYYDEGDAPSCGQKISPLDKPFYAKDFSKKKWRGARK